MAKPPTFAATPIRLQPVEDFTGGLNLRADAFQLGQNESPDMLDMIAQIGGGFLQRNVVVPYSAALAAVPNNVFSYQTVSVQQVVATTATAAYFSTGGSWTSLGITIPALPTSVIPRAKVFNNNLYMVFGSAKSPLKWNGTTVTNMGSAFNNTIGTEGANDGNMPNARYMCVHDSMVFLAYTTEGGTDFPNRIRWSHPGFAEDWRAQDFIDIDIGANGDFITGIIEFKNKIYIFKNNSVYILSGYSPTTFQVIPESMDIGAVSQDAILVTDVGLFNFSWPQGVYLDRGSGPYPIFDKLYPLIRDGFIPPGSRHKIAMGWVNQMLWCAIPYNGSTVNTRVLVYNPWIYKNRYLRFLQGPWYPYNMSIANFANVYTPFGQSMWLAANSQLTYVGQLEQQGNQDNWGAGLTNINSYYRTRWYDLGQDAVFKRWRHPDVAMRPTTVAPVAVEVRKDYNFASVYKNFQLFPKVPITGMNWDIDQPVQAAITQGGTGGGTTYGYRVTALLGSLEGLALPETTTATGNATLSVTNFNTISWAAVPFATSYNVYGRTAGAEHTLIGNTSSLTFNDTGQTGTSQSPPAVSGLGGLWDDGSGLVGGVWSANSTTAETIARGASMGSARSVQLSFYAPPGLTWGVDEITLKYVPKRVRG